MEIKILEAESNIAYLYGYEFETNSGLVLIAFGIVSQTVDIEYEYISTRYDEICA